MKRLAGCISCHVWNKEGTKVALSPNNNEILIFAKTDKGYELEHSLKEHDQVITGLDWSHTTNQIVSCSHDRNAYVWTLEGGIWKPVLVILRLSKCCTHVKWSPLGNKFAVASGAKSVSVCNYEDDNKWWVSKHIKKHKSTVLRVAWHPNNILLATASSDFKCRIFGAAIKGVDTGSLETPFGPKAAFGECYAEIDICMGWVQAVRWSPSGNLLAFVGQDSTLAVSDISSGQPAAATVLVKYNNLPFRDLLFVDETSIVAVGFDCTPVLFQNTGGWKFARQVDSGDSTGGGAAAKSNAFNAFKAKVDKGEEKTETKLGTKHQNCITWIEFVGASNKYSTSGLDGNLVIWG